MLLINQVVANSFWCLYGVHAVVMLNNNKAIDRCLLALLAL